MTKRWVDPQPVSVPDDLRALVGGHPLVAETLVRRGIIQPQAAGPFLNPNDYVPSNPAELPDAQKAVDRIRQAIRQGQRIGIWGDFDVDGQTSTALLFSALRDAGANVTYHIPNRFHEGHGMSVPYVQREIDAGVQMILTCDTGISAHEAVEHAQSQGVDVVVTDHHNLPDTLPAAHALVNPKRLPEDHPMRDLPGVGVAFMLMRLMLGEQAVWPLLDLVALGIVADVAYQRADTRYWLQRGLDVLRNTERLGLVELMSLAGINPAELDEQHIGFGIGPRLNALGRLADANPAVELLTTTDLERARILANELDSYNSERKYLSNQVYEGAKAQLTQNSSLGDYATLVLGHPDWHPGVVGIVASRLVEEYNKPVVLLTTPEDQPAHGSARSVEGCDITAAIASQSDMLIGYGGHTMAAGLRLPLDQVDDFRRGLSRAVREQVGQEAPPPTLYIDGYLKLDELTPELVADLQRLAPFGAGNPPLTLVSNSLKLVSRKQLGRSGDHLKLHVRDDQDGERDVIWWGGGRESLPEQPFDLAYTVRMNDYRGRRELLIEWLDQRPSADAELITEAPEPQQIFIDLRQADDPRSQLELMRQQYPDALVWREADNAVDGVNRYQLRPASTLIVWTIPPYSTDWAYLLSEVQPETVILLGLDPGVDDTLTFVRRLIGLVRYAMNQKGGFVRMAQLEAATAHREATVRAGLRYIQARGDIQVTEEDRDLFISAGDGSPGADIKPAAAHLERLLNETAAYRRYWRRMPVD